MPRTLKALRKSMPTRCSVKLICDIAVNNACQPRGERHKYESSMCTLCVQSAKMLAVLQL
eukprot:COSAG06_NODE_9545_length_1874_cov_1.647324_2_plen_60_part_00